MQVEKTEKPKTPKGRAKKRLLYNRRSVYKSRILVGPHGRRGRGDAVRGGWVSGGGGRREGCKVEGTSELKHRTAHVGSHRPFHILTHTLTRSLIQSHTLYGPLRTSSLLNRPTPRSRSPATPSSSGRTYRPSRLTLLPSLPPPSHRFVNVTLLPGGKRKMCVHLATRLNDNFRRPSGRWPIRELPPISLPILLLPPQPPNATPTHDYTRHSSIRPATTGVLTNYMHLSLLYDFTNSPRSPPAPLSPPSFSGPPTDPPPSFVRVPTGTSSPLESPVKPPPTHTSESDIGRVGSPSSSPFRSSVRVEPVLVVVFRWILSLYACMPLLHGVVQLGAGVAREREAEE